METNTEKSDSLLADILESIDRTINGLIIKTQIEQYDLQKMAQNRIPTLRKKLHIKYPEASEQEIKIRADRDFERFMDQLRAGTDLIILQLHALCGYRKEYAEGQLSHTSHSNT